MGMSSTEFPTRETRTLHGQCEREIDLLQPRQGPTGFATYDDARMF